MKKSRYTWKSTKRFDPKRHASPVHSLIINGTLSEKLRSYGFTLHPNPVTPGSLDTENFIGRIVQPPLGRGNSSLIDTVLTPSASFFNGSDNSDDDDDTDRIDITDTISRGSTTELFVFGHYVEEKDKYFYFESGDAEDPGEVGCGSTKYRVSKDIVLHFYDTGETCNDSTDNIIQFFF